MSKLDSLSRLSDVNIIRVFRTLSNGRLEKRSRISIGGHLIFADIDTGDDLEAIVIGLKRFNSFDEPFAAYPKSSLGYCLDEPCSSYGKGLYYSKEQQKRYGVMVIEILLCKIPSR